MNQQPECRSSLHFTFDVITIRVRIESGSFCTRGLFEPQDYASCPASDFGGDVAGLSSEKSLKLVPGQAIKNIRLL
jgi:hypothetical protein